MCTSLNLRLFSIMCSLMFVSAPPITYENPKAKTKVVKQRDVDDLTATTYSLDKAPILDDFISLICEPKNEVRYMFMKKPFGSASKEVVLCTANTDRDSGFDCKVSRKALIDLISQGLGLDTTALDAYTVRLDNALPFHRGVLLEFVAGSARCFVYCPFSDLPKNKDAGWPMDVSRWQLVSGNNVKSFASTLSTGNDIALDYNLVDRALSTPVAVLDPRYVDVQPQAGGVPADKSKSSDALAEKISGVVNQNNRSSLSWKSDWFENNLDTGNSRYQIRQLIAPSSDWVGVVSQIPSETNWRIEWFHLRDKRYVFAPTTSPDGSIHFTQSVDSLPVVSFLDYRTGLPVVQYAYNRAIYSLSLKMSGSTYVSEVNPDYNGEDSDGNIVDFRSNLSNLDSANALGALLVVHQKVIILKVGSKPRRDVLWPDRRAIANSDTLVAANFVNLGQKLVLLTYSLVDKAKLHVFDLNGNASGRL